MIGAAIGTDEGATSDTFGRKRMFIIEMIIFCAFLVALVGAAGVVTYDAVASSMPPAIAFSKSSRPTISIRNDCRAGTSNAFTTPSSVDSVIISQTRIIPVSVSVARTNASSMDDTCVAITTVRRGHRSATRPPSGDRRKIGIWFMKPSTPSSTEE